MHDPSAEQEKVRDAERKKAGGVTFMEAVGFGERVRQGLKKR
jgi:hypothetical protein